MNEQIKNEQTRVIKEGSGFSIYLFAKENPDTDIRALERAIIERKDADSAYLFAKDVVGADTKALEQLVIDNGCSFDMVRFARSIPGADVKALERAIIDLGEDFGALQFAADIPGADIASLGLSIIERGSPGVARQFAARIPGADLKAMERFIIEKGTVGDMLHIASILVDASLEPDFDAISMIVIKQGSGDEICGFAELFYDKRILIQADNTLDDSIATIKALERAVFKRGTPLDMVQFIQSIPGVDLDKARKKFLKIRDEHDRIFAIAVLDGIEEEMVA